MTAQVGIVIPYHEREHSFETLAERVLPPLGSQGAYGLHLDGNLHGIVLRKFLDDPIVRLINTVDTAELRIITDAAVHPDTHNCCTQINIGAKSLSSEVMVLLLQDVEADPFTIERMVDHVLVNPDDLIYATVHKQKYRNDAHPLYWVGPERQNEAWFLMACNRQKFIDIGGVDEDFWQYWGWEDLEFLNRATYHFNVKWVDWAKALHMWHPETHAKYKGGANGMYYADKIKIPDRIANAGKEWGKIYVP